MKVLVTGGAGYIGSFMTRTLLDKGHEVVVFDSLERGHKEVMDVRAEFVQGNIQDKELLENMFSSQDISAVLHFAGYISVEESTKNPQKYFLNNVKGSEILFKAAIEIGEVDNFIFSSTAAVYGNPVTVPIPEEHPKNPTSPYGMTKLATERTLEHLREENGISYACLRYFNAAGGTLDGSLGEDHNPETHLIPNAIRAALNNTEFKLFGADYKTPDGTCIRDYIHVLDLVDAHLLALKKIENKSGGHIYNVGTGNGFSNKEVIDMVKKVSGRDFRIKLEPRRAGDSDKLIADVTKIKNELGFMAQYSDLQTIVESSWKWHERKLKNQNEKWKI